MTTLTQDLEQELLKREKGRDKHLITEDEINAKAK
jgi:hypothetical protein